MCLSEPTFVPGTDPSLVQKYMKGGTGWGLCLQLPEDGYEMLSVK